MGLLAQSKRKSPNSITSDDVQTYVNTLPSRASQDAAIAAIKSFMKMAGRTIDDDLVLLPKSDPKEIEELTPDEMKTLIGACRTDTEKILLLVLRDTGIRISAVCNTEITDYHGTHIVFPPEKMKRHVSAVAPISDETKNAIDEYIRRCQPRRYLFEESNGQPLDRNNAYRMVVRVAKRCGIKKHVHPHAFRHWRALELRRQHTEVDVVTKAMGWKNPTMYHTRYGKRSGAEVVEELRKTFATATEPPKEKPVEHPPNMNDIIRLLDAKLIDNETAKMMLAKMDRKERETPQIYHV
jgi:integrase